MRIYIDTEFTSFEAPALISIGMVADTSPPAEFYAELVPGDFDASSCSDFVRKVVMPALGKRPDRILTIEQLRSEVLTWVKQFASSQPVLSYDYSGDFGFFKAIVGDIPGWLQNENINSKFSEDVVDEFFLTNPHHVRHHALHDALALMHAHKVGWPSDATGGW